MVALWLHWNCNHKSEKCNSQKRVRQIGICLTKCFVYLFADFLLVLH